MIREIDNLELTLGPLQYRLRAHDRWGADLLGRIAARVDRVKQTGAVQRQVHLSQLPVTTDIPAAGRLPRSLADLTEARLPATGWQVTTSATRQDCWHHADTPHAFWTDSGRGPSLPFNLPLDLLLHDIVATGGGILHGGLAVYREQGVLLTAPPGGGKTTVLSTLPPDWQLRSDDAALVWPEAGRFCASPLPTWSVLLGVNPQLERIDRWQIGTSCPLRLLVLLDKADTVRLERQRPLEATYPLYRALSEYPTVIMGRGPHRLALFRTAAALARTVPTCALQLPRRSDIWPRLHQELSDGGQ